MFFNQKKNVVQSLRDRANRALSVFNEAADELREVIDLEKENIHINRGKIIHIEKEIAEGEEDVNRLTKVLSKIESILEG
jgi:malonyl CoA-acyl carrier protein transacylase